MEDEKCGRDCSGQMKPTLRAHGGKLTLHIPLHTLCHGRNTLCCVKLRRCFSSANTGKNVQSSCTWDWGRGSPSNGTTTRNKQPEILYNGIVWINLWVKDLTASIQSEDKFISRYAKLEETCSGNLQQKVVLQNIVSGVLNTNPTLRTTT